MHIPSLRGFLSCFYLIRLIAVIAGLFLFAVGTVFIYRSAMGLGPWDVLQKGLSLHTPLSFGEANMLIGVLIVVVSIALKVYPGVGTLLSMFLVGIFEDWLLRLNWLPDLSSAPLLLRLLINVVGVLILGFSTAVYIAPRMGAGPRDGLMLRLQVLTKMRISLIRAIIECTALLIGFLLGGTVGVGTLIFAFGIGPAVEISFLLAKKLRLVELLQPTAPNVKPSESLPLRQ